VTVISRAGCHLCEEAEAVVGGLAGELGFRWHVLDVDSSAELQNSFGNRVPVILLDGTEHGYWRVEEARLRRALAAAGPVR
jgi:Glutaredoxin-like domain (DUF836)